VRKEADIVEVEETTKRKETSETEKQ